MNVELALDRRKLALAGSGALVGRTLEPSWGKNAVEMSPLNNLHLWLAHTQQTMRSLSLERLPFCP